MLWLSYREAWKSLQFSTVHGSKSKVEQMDEYYQVLFESAFILWLENSSVREQFMRLEHTCILVYTWYCVIQTFKDGGCSKDGIAP